MVSTIFDHVITKGWTHTLEVSEVCLLVEVGLLETERVDNVDLGLLLVVGILITTLGGSVGTSLVGNAVNLLEVVRVGDELVAADDVLRRSGQSGVRAQTRDAPPSVARSRGCSRDSRCK
jgi:hypothetical protein